VWHSHENETFFWLQTSLPRGLQPKKCFVFVRMPHAEDLVFSTDRNFCRNFCLRNPPILSINLSSPSFSIFLFKFLPPSSDLLLKYMNFVNISHGSFFHFFVFSYICSTPPFFYLLVKVLPFSFLLLCILSLCRKANGSRLPRQRSAS